MKKPTTALTAIMRQAHATEIYAGFLAALAERNERSRLRVRPGSITSGFAKIVALGRVVGVDLNEYDARRVEELARIVEPSNATFRSADIYALPFAGGSFDVVFAYGAMEHLAELDTAIRKMVRVLNPGGLIGARITDCGGHIHLPQDSLINGPLKLIEQIVKGNGENRNMGRHMKGFVYRGGNRTR